MVARGLERSLAGETWEIFLAAEMHQKHRLRRILSHHLLPEVSTKAAQALGQLQMQMSGISAGQSPENHRVAHKTAQAQSELQLLQVHYRQANDAQCPERKEAFLWSVELS
jgi:hypothetical protein